MTEPTELNATPTDFGPLTCVLPDCSESLYLSWVLTVALTGGDLTDNRPSRPDDADAGGWRVECLAGHVILLPGSEEIGDENSACADGTCEHDHCDELRTWQRADVDRLAALLGAHRG